MKRSLLAAAVMVALSGAVSAAEIYDINKNYTGGEQVSFNGNVYEAQWWAGAGQSPKDITENSWDSPWVLVSEGNGSTAPTPNPNPTPEPELEVPDVAAPDLSDHDAYASNVTYAGGDIVSNNGKLYRCKEGVTVAWCSGAAWAYAPGTGSAWDMAWEEVTGSDVGGSTSPEVKPEVDVQPEVKPEVKPEVDVQPEVKPDGTYVVTKAELEQQEEQITDFPAMTAVKEAIRTLDNELVEAIVPGAATNPENVQRVESIVSAQDWDYMFAKRTHEYTYRHFLQATGKFPAFCGSYDDGRDADAICRKSLATMFAHFTQETGGHTAWWDVPEWRQGLVHVREMGWDENMRGGYNGECNPDVWQGQTWPCGTFDNGEFKSYFGRGAKQLSYNYNYGPFSLSMYGTVRTLLDAPEMVADTWLNLASAVFFFVYPQPPKPSMLHVIDGTWQPNDRDISNGLTTGFGVTTQIINGGVECGGSVEVAQSVNRISYYKSFAEYLGVEVPADEILGCKGMKSFDEDGAGAVKIYWEQDWGWTPDTPDGATYKCQLVGYQTPYSAFTAGDYVKCVEANFPQATII